jgi:hypothetical protein
MKRPSEPRGSKFPEAVTFLEVSNEKAPVHVDSWCQGVARTIFVTSQGLVRHQANVAPTTKVRIVAEYLLEVVHSTI